MMFGWMRDSINDFDVCVTVHHIWKWREVPTWCNNYDLLFRWVIPVVLI